MDKLELLTVSRAIDIIAANGREGAVAIVEAVDSGQIDRGNWDEFVAQIEECADKVIEGNGGTS